MRTLLKWLLPLAILSASASLAIVIYLKRPQVKPAPVEHIPPLVEVMEVRPRAHQFRLVTQGEVAARTEIQLMAEVAGRVEWVAEPFGDGGFFTNSQPLLRVDARDYEVAIAQAQAALAQARVRLQRETAEAKVAREEWEKLGKGPANPLLLREPQLAEARAAVASAEANVAKAELDLTRCEIRAPFTGRVRQKLADVGQFLNRGAPVARVYAVDYSEVRLPLPLDELAFIELPLAGALTGPGPAAVLRGTVGSEVFEWSGRVVRTDGEINPRTRMLNCVVRVDDPYGITGTNARPPLAVGLFVNAELEGRRIDSVLVVPRSAMRGRDTLVVIDAEKRLRFRKVTVLRYKADEVLLQGGMEPGDRVCLSLLDAPVDGMQVRVAEAERAGQPIALPSSTSGQP